MKVIAFLGSPRKDGNSETLLKEAVRGVESAGFGVTIFRLNEMNMRPCQNCGGCDETGQCIIDDDMTGIFHDIRDADRIIVASPIFFFGLSAQTKIMIDRCQSFWCEKYLLRKPVPAGEHGRKGLLMLVGGMKKEVGVQCAGSTATAFFRTISVPEHKTLSYLNIDAKGAIGRHPTALQEAFEAGKELVSVIA